PIVVLKVARVTVGAFAQVARQFACLRRQDMTSRGMVPQDLARGGLLEALGGSPMGLEFRQGYLPTNTAHHQTRWPVHSLVLGVMRRLGRILKYSTSCHTALRTWSGARTPPPRGRNAGRSSKGSPTWFH